MLTWPWGLQEDKQVMSYYKYKVVLTVDIGSNQWKEINNFIVKYCCNTVCKGEMGNFNGFATFIYWSLLAFRPLGLLTILCCACKICSSCMQDYFHFCLLVFFVPKNRNEECLWKKKPKRAWAVSCQLFSMKSLRFQIIQSHNLHFPTLCLKKEIK